ncbi:MAG: hypothetical protein A2Y76_12955 [Planctomycetes bacterium RBG_13_60_9]|nr:MAG: hypothetical protein A2Y76_12955 [Planctomycetes bacterium RBG_13_60_9]
MNKHLTEQQLIDYQFKLASDAALNEARAHLEGCEECRLRLQELTRKFATLDLLRDDVQVSEALLSKTVENAVSARAARLIPFYRLPWLGAVAAAVIVGLAVLMVSTVDHKQQQAPSLTLNPTQEAAEESIVPTEKTKTAAPASVQLVAAGSRVSDKVDDGEKKAEPVLMAMAQAQPKEIAEQPPFAPASAIELVVLPRRENVQLTIYNSADLTLVRERRNLTLKRGWNWLQFMWASTLIDPTSLHLEPLEHQEGVQVQQLVFPPRLRGLGRWLIRSEVGGQVPFELTYFTSGLSWRAFYMGTLSQDEKTMRLEGYVRVSNSSGEDYEDAQTRLIVGQVHLLDEIAELAQRQYAYGRPGRSAGSGGMKEIVETIPKGRGSDLLVITTSLEDRPKEIRKEGLSEDFLYTIEGTETIPNQWGKRLLSFEVNDIPVTNLYKYDEQRWGTRTMRFLSFSNDQEHKLGQTPLPDGTVRVYGRADEQGHLSYVGAMPVKYIPVGEEVELDLGPARLVEVKPALMDFKTQNYALDTKGDIAGWDEVRTWKIEMVNAGTLPAEVEVTRGFETPYWTLTSEGTEVAYEKHDATRARFKTTVAPRSTQVFQYEVTTYHGVREEILSDKTVKTKN